MEYVMVPVPEEVVDEVKAFLQWELGKPPAAPDNPDAVAEIYEAADPTLRTIMRTVAEASVEGDRLPARRVAEAAGINIRELMGALTELNVEVHKAGGPMGTIMTRPDHRSKPDHVSEFDHKALHMTDAVAAQIIDR